MKFVTKSDIQKYGAIVKETPNATIIKVKGGEKEQTELWRKLHSTRWKTRFVENTRDGIVISRETHKQRKKRTDKEKKEFVKDALRSGKYKGSTEKKAKAIFLDSPYSIHSWTQIYNLVKKHDKPKSKSANAKRKR